MARRQGRRFDLRAAGDAAMISRVVFEDHECVEVVHPDGERLVVTTDVGPRILGYLTANGENHLAVLPDAGLNGPNGRFHFVGGHRLWVAPEQPDLTYLPDERPCEVATDGDTVVVSAPDNGSGLQRSLQIAARGSGFSVGHLIVNVGDEPTAPVAPWAITQFPVGGTAVLAFRPDGGGPKLQASHALVLWSYTDPDDERLTIGADHVLVEATTEASPCKVGVVPGSGRLGYLRDGVLFVKEASPPDGPVPDLGAASQVYTGAGFAELETLGAVGTLDPGESTSLRELWSIQAVSNLGAAIDKVSGRS